MFFLLNYTKWCIGLNNDKTLANSYRILYYYAYFNYVVCYNLFFCFLSFNCFTSFSFFNGMYRWDDDLGHVYCLLRTWQTENFLILTLSEWPPSAQARLSDGKTLKFRGFVKLLI